MANEEANAPPNGAGVIDSTAVEEGGQSTAVAVPPAPAPPPTLGVAPQASAADLVARLSAIKEAQKDAMEENVDYGVIPGTDKPTLFKPGAEKLAALFQLDVEPQNEKRWEADEHLTVVSRVTIFHAPTGARLGSGEGLCTTREKKYAVRNAQRKCPDCGVEAVIKGKEEYGGGWLCFKKKGGCGAKWPDGEEAIEKQEVGEVDNPDLPDLWNTVLKMAKKRGFVDAVLAVTGASAVFTQDVEDTQPTGDASSSAPEAEPPRPPLQADRVLKIGQGIGALGMTYKDVALMLGAVGADNRFEETSAGTRSVLERLSSEQADQVEARLEARAAQDAQPADQSQDGGEGDE